VEDFWLYEGDTPSHTKESRLPDGSITLVINLRDDLIRIVVLEIGGPPETATRSSLYVYVPDVDATYRRAMQAGATSLREPVQQPYRERNAGVKDTFGNVWWIATYTG
jgi:PhnB protein